MNCFGIGAGLLKNVELITGFTSRIADMAITPDTPEAVHVTIVPSDETAILTVVPALRVEPSACSTIVAPALSSSSLASRARSLS